MPNEAIDLGDEEVNIDTIFKKIGQFGNYQKYIYLLICIPMFCNGFFAFTYVFTASSAATRCKIAECDSVNSSYIEPWLNFTIPLHGESADRFSSCTRYESLSNQTILEGTCNKDFFNRSRVTECDDFVFKDKEVSIAKEFNIFCAKEWMLPLVGSINCLAQFVGIPLGGYISDRYGRRTVIALAGSLSTIIGMIRSFAPNYTSFVILEFLDAVFGNSLFGAVFLLAIELSGPKNRVLVCSALSLVFPLGEIGLALTARHTGNWRLLLRYLYAPGVIHFLYFWILPESTRWLLSNKKDERLTAELRRAARMNKKPLHERDLIILLKSNKNNNDEKEETYQLAQAFKVFFWRIANCCICYFANALVYYGLSLNSVLLGGDKYHNFIILAIAEVPGYVLPYFIMDRFGRRHSLCGCMLVSGLSIAATLFISSDQRMLILSLFLIGKFTITASFQVLYFYTAEIFPTSVRHSLLSFCSCFGRIGSITAPQTTLLAKYFALGPTMIFSCAAITAGALALTFSETANTILPNTLDDAETIGTEKSKNITK